MFLRCLCAALALVAAAAGAQAQDNYPSQPIRLIVPHPPGGFTDILARLVAQRLGANTGQPVVVENKGGGGGTIAERFVATAPGDGYTLLLTARDVMSRGEMHARLPYDPDRDFTPVSLLAWSPTVLVAHPSLAANNPHEFIALVRRSPGKISYASGGTGTGGHVAMEMLARDAGLQMVHIPYKGPAQAMNDVLGGQVPVTLVQVAVALPQIQAGRLKALAVPGSHRLAALPNVPTIAEAAVPGFDVTPWFGILAPGTTPKPVVQKLAAELNKVMASPDVRAELARTGAEAVGSSADDFAALVKKETPKWRRIVREANIREE
jgi:tripartite-type tricarboxylate transporter receptor subunit TctC